VGVFFFLVSLLRRSGRRPNLDDPIGSSAGEYGKRRVELDSQYAFFALFPVFCVLLETAVGVKEVPEAD